MFEDTSECKEFKKEDEEVKMSEKQTSRGETTMKSSEELAKMVLATDCEWKELHIHVAKLLDQARQEGYEKGLNDMKRVNLQRGKR